MARTTVPSPPFLGADFVPRDWARPDLSGEGSAPPAEGERTRTAGASASAPAKAEAQAGASHAPEAASAPGKNNAAPAPVPPAAAFPRTSPQPAFGTPGLGFPTTTFSRPPGSVYTADATPAARAKAKDDINFVFTPPPNFKPAFGGAPGAGSPVFGRPSKLESALGRSPSQAKSGPDEDVEMAAASPIGPAPQPAKEPERASGPAAEAPAVPASSAFTFEVPSPSAAAQNEPPKFQKTVFPWGSFFGEPSPASPGPLSPDRPSAVPAPTPPKPSIAPTPPKPQPPPNMDEFRTPVAPPPRAAEERRPEPPKVSPKEQERMRAAVMRKDGDALMRAKRYAEAAEKYTEALASPFLDDLQLCLLDRSAAYLAQHKWGAGLRDAADALEHLLALPILDQKLLGHAYDAAQRAAQAFTALGKVDDAVSALRRTVDRAKHPGASAAADPRRANKLDEQLRTLLSIQADLRAHDRELLQGRYPAALDLIEAAMRRINHFLPAGRIPPSQNLGHVVPFDWIVRRAALYVASCRFAEAEAAFTAALQVDPTSAGILYLKAVAYYVRDPDGGSLSAVEADLARALQFDPEHAASRSFLRDVVRSVERNNTAAKAKYAKGDAASVAAAKGMWEAALATLDSIGLGWKEEAPDDGDAADPRRVWRGGIVRVKLAGNLASALLKMGKTAESIAQRKGALAMLLAVAFPGSRDRSAITAGEMARTPYRDLFARTYALLAEAYEKDGSTQESVDAWQRALDVDPRKPEFAQGLSRAKRLLARASKTTYYSVLGVARDATQDQIKKAYRQMALQVHPDKQPAELRPQAETKFKHLQEAYETLSSPSKRSDYDYKLRTEEREDDFGTGGLGGMGGFGASAYSAYARRPYSAGRRYQPPTDHEYDYDEDDFFENLFAGAGRRTQGKRSTAYGGSYSGGGSSSSSRSGTSSGARSGPGTWHTPGPKGSGTGGKR
ncbi:hypothetical protein DFJ74DRAFT_467569 [Hyaloraphidium curvatum]|nr:hypothetical protein DFJ74DRAFT_467569 [Hyaloraphidium curvatum]